ncbi:C1QL [Mytilus coruscus]|uniref:C1QL n=1 Tax=Mytilus coruscus TaxID=42192 RepID=A0A6J8DXL4_MYTCO|nr:C1QL [Mytilus coruscus]
MYYLLILYLFSNVVTERCSKEIQVLRNENQILRRIVSKVADELTEHKNALDELIVFKKSFENYTTARENERRMHDRRLTNGPIIAFHAFLSKGVSSLGIQHTVPFDAEMTDTADRYNPYSHVFTVPESGVYVFTWTILIKNIRCSTELVVNATVIGRSYPDSERDDENDTSTVIVIRQVEKDDVIFVRVKIGCSSIRSDLYGRSSLSGWKL